MAKHMLRKLVLPPKNFATFWARKLWSLPVLGRPVPPEMLTLPETQMALRALMRLDVLVHHHVLI